MRKTSRILGAAALTAGLAGQALAGGPVALNLTILHNNDAESQIINAGTGALADFGGVARFKTLADQLKAQAASYPSNGAPNGVVMISSGDNFLAGPEFDASLSLPPGPAYYDSIAMGLIGYDAATIGNHEFDFGPDVFERFVAGVTPAVPFLSANLDFSGEPGLAALETTGRLAKSTILNINGFQVGVVGATTETLPFVSFPRNVGVLAVLAAVQAEVNALDLAGVKIIILSSHLQGLSSEGALIPFLSKVDVVIGGGGGELLANPSAALVPGDTATGAIAGITGTGYPRSVVDSDGKSVPLVTTRGDYRYIGRLIVSFDANGEVVGIDPLSDVVRVSGVAPDAVVPDPVVQAQVVDPVAAHVAGLQSTVIGFSQVPLDGRTNEVRSVETNLGNLTADALLYNATVNAAAVGSPLPDVALQNGGGIRNNSILPVGNFTEFNTFEVLPFSNFVTIVRDIPAAQFKEILENCVSRVGLSSNGRFAQVAGFRFAWNPAGTAQVLDSNLNVTTPGNRVREVILDDGTVLVRDGVVLPGARNINVATLDFLARGGDQFPFRGAPFSIVPVSYQQSLDRYIVQWLSGNITGREYRAGGEGRITRVTSFSIAGLLNEFGARVETSGGRLANDVNRDGVVDTRDLVELLHGTGQLPN